MNLEQAYNKKSLSNSEQLEFSTFSLNSSNLVKSNNLSLDKSTPPLEYTAVQKF